ncbi:MAG TPA: porin family protein [Rhizobacter sp.]|nr:porin family protein [Rhizobacter sp.]
MRVKAHLLIACLAGVCASAAHAQSQPVGTGLYVGGSIGQSMWKGSDAFDLDTRKTGGKLYGGYQFSPYFSMELGLVDLGKFDSSVGSIKANGAFLDAVGTLPFAPKWSGLARAGGFYGQLDNGAHDDSGTSWKLGVGVQYDLTPNAALRAEYERYRFNALDINPNTDLLSVGFNYRF